MGALPTMMYDPRTRTGNECLLYYNLGLGIKVGDVGFTATDDAFVQYVNCGEYALTAPSGGFMAVVANPPNRGAVEYGSVNVLPANTPLYGAAELLDQALTVDVTDITLDGVSGDTVEILALPDPTNDVLICFDNAFSFNPGSIARAIPRKFNIVDHRVRQRPENRVQINNLFVCNWRGIEAIAGRAVTLILKIFPSGGAFPCEIRYYTNVMPFPNLPIQAEGNNSVETSLDSEFAYCAIFSAPIATEAGVPFVSGDS